MTTDLSLPEVPPATPDELHDVLTRVLEIHVPRTALVEGHDAPFDYLCAAFFDEPLPDGPPPDLLVWANRGGGKTFLAAVATALDLAFKPGIQVRLVAGSVEQGQKMHAHLATLLERPALAPLVKGRLTERRVRLVNGSGAELLAPSQASVRGTRVQRIRCDEVELFRPELWDAVQLATRSRRCGGRLAPGRVEAFSTMHLPYGLMSRLVAQSAAGRRRVFKWGVVDVLEHCPPSRACAACALEPECRGRAKARPSERAGHLPIDDAVAMKRRVALPVWEAEMACRRPQRSDSVYPEFDPEAHVVDAGAWLEAARARESPEPLVVTAVASMDFGFRAPTAILWGLWVRRGGAEDAGVLVITRERIVTGVVLGEHARTLAEGPTVSWVAVDPAGEQVNDQTGVSAVRVLRDAGVTVRVRRAPIGAGIALVRARLRPGSGGPRLLVDRSCAGLARALEEYHYDPRRPEEVTPVKDGPDHAADALRYLVVSLDHHHQTSSGTY